jgi:protein subunit release factor B
VTYPVSGKKVRELEERMARLNLKDSDFEETFVRSGGAGGQNVNKVSTCVVLKHIQSGLVVRCQQERSQALNRFLAMRLMVDKIEAERLGIRTAKQAEFEKIRRQKRRRGRRAKEKMLAQKKMRSEVKAMRRKILE